jgi:hypothetical protein
MARSIEHRSSFSFPAEQVYATVTDEDYLRQRLSEIGGVDSELVSRTADNGTVRIVMRQGIDPDDLPGIVKRVVPDGVLIERSESWTAEGGGPPYTATMEASVRGIKGTVSGTTKIADSGQGSEQTTTGEVDIDIPLVGGKIESVIAEQLRELLEVEAQFTKRWLESH